MILELLIRPEAEMEMGEAYEWYEEHSPGLGSQFLLSIDATLHDIQRRPEQFQVVYKTLRRALIRRFPYQVVFMVQPDKIVVVAVFHARRNPKHWMERSG